MPAEATKFRGAAKTLPAPAKCLADLLARLRADPDKLVSGWAERLAAGDRAESRPGREEGRPGAVPGGPQRLTLGDAPKEVTPA